MTATQSLKVFSDGSVVPETPVVNIQRQFYRIPWDTERYDYNSDPQRLGYTGGSGGSVRQVVLDRGEAMPAVFRFNPDYHAVLNCACQKLWRELNPKLSVSKWATLLGNGLAWTNGSGFPGHYNCLTGADKGETLPRFDQMRICAGAIITGKENRGYLEIETIRPESLPDTSGLNTISSIHNVDG